MRPLERLPNGKQYKTYQSYKTDLETHYGPFCAYCEKQGRDLDVEHVEPASKSGKVTDWTNLLLACPTCNRDYKKARNDTRAGYAFPDDAETFALFNYLRNGTIQAQSPEAEAMKTLCGLGRSQASSDRADLFFLCCRFKSSLVAGRQTPEEIVGYAKIKGYWSVWMTAFHDIPAVVALLCDPRHFPGTRPTFARPTAAPAFACP